MVSGQCPQLDPLSLQAWLRPLQQGLQLEADRGFANLQGRRELFHSFLSRSLRQPPQPLPPHQQNLLEQLAGQFDTYPDQSHGQRQSLVRRARQALHELQRAHEPVRPPAPPRLLLSRRRPGWRG